MRISDWSSDVCSSDLSIGDRGEALAFNSQEGFRGVSGAKTRGGGGTLCFGDGNWCWQVMAWRNARRILCRKITLPRRFRIGVRIRRRYDANAQRQLEARDRKRTRLNARHHCEY